jgi:hypothetical protein
VWQAALNSVLPPRSLECPCCANKKSSVTNSLLTVRPDIAKLWSGDRNGEFKNPASVVATSGAMVWLRSEDYFPPREWSVVLRDVVLAEGLPVPPPLPPPEEKVVELVRELVEGVEEEALLAAAKAAAEAEAEEDERRRRRIREEGEEGEEEKRKKVQEKITWKRKFSGVLSSMLTSSMLTNPFARKKKEK